MQPIDKIIKKVAVTTLKETGLNTSNTEEQNSALSTPVCPICGGVGFVRQELPLDHPDFGKLQLCVCQAQNVARSAHQRLFKLSNLEAYSQMTFDNFNPAGRGQLGDEQVRSLTTAHRVAQQFAQTLQGWLLLMGNFGSGKTHLAAAIANQAVSLGVRTLFLTVPDLLDWLRFSYGSAETSFEERFDEIRNIPLLVMDDLGTQNTTSWAVEKLFQILNYRYVNHLTTVLTTNQNFEEIDGRIRSRLQDPELVIHLQMNSPDYRQPAMDAGHTPLSSLHLYNALTFGNFSLREPDKLSDEKMQSIKKAFRAAHEFAENPLGWLVLMGDYGVGKTHLAAAIGNYRNSLGEEPMFVVVPDLLDHLRATFNPSSPDSYDSMFWDIRTTRLLILDDLGTQSATPWAREKLYQIFNHRYIAKLATVITTTSNMENLDPRIRTRMLDRRVCTTYVIDVPPYHLGIGGSGQEKTHKTSRRPSSKTIER